MSSDPTNVIQEELDGRVQAPRPAPDPDDEVHRDQHDLPEDVEQEEVEATNTPSMPVVSTSSSA